MSIIEKLDALMKTADFHLYYNVRRFNLSFEQLHTLFGEDVSLSFIHLPESRSGYASYYYLFQEDNRWYQVNIDPCFVSSRPLIPYIIVNESLPVPSLYTPLDEHFVHRLVERQQDIQHQMQRLESESTCIEQAVSHPSCRLYGLFHS